MVDRPTVVEDLAIPATLGGSTGILLLSSEGGIGTTPARRVVLGFLLDESFVVALDFLVAMGLMVSVGAGVFRGIVAANSGRPRRNWG